MEERTGVVKGFSTPVTWVTNNFTILFPIQRKKIVDDKNTLFNTLTLTKPRLNMSKHQVEEVSLD